MADMVALIETLIQRGAAYVSYGEVLFDVNAYDAGTGRYGKLSGRALDDMIAGAAGRGGGQQASRRRLRAVETLQARRAVVAGATGTGGASRLAYRMLGDG